MIQGCNFGARFSSVAEFLNATPVSEGSDERYQAVPGLVLPRASPDKRAIRCVLARCTVIDHMNCKLAVITHKHGKLPYRLAPRPQP